MWMDWGRGWEGRRGSKKGRQLTSRPLPRLHHRPFILSSLCSTIQQTPRWGVKTQKGTLIYVWPIDSGRTIDPLEAFVATLMRVEGEFIWIKDWNSDLKLRLKQKHDFIIQIIQYLPLLPLIHSLLWSHVAEAVSWLTKSISLVTFVNFTWSQL